MKLYAIILIAMFLVGAALTIPQACALHNQVKQINNTLTTPTP